MGERWKAMTKEERAVYDSSQPDSSITSSSLLQDINTPTEGEGTGTTMNADVEDLSLQRVKSQSLAQSRNRFDRWMDDWQCDVSQLGLEPL